MNTHFRLPSLPPTTNAAEGMQRRRWSFDEIEAMVKAGIIPEDERFELIGGEVVPMSPKGNQHEMLKVALTVYWAKRLPDTYLFATETTFRISADTFLEPDFVFYRKDLGLAKLKPDNALLVVEVGVSSLGYDLGRKAGIYAGCGVRELWVIDAEKLETHIHRLPGKDGYAHIDKFGADQLLTPGFASEFAVQLSGLHLA